jgi:hypothetical protein
LVALIVKRVARLIGALVKLTRFHVRQLKRSVLADVLIVRLRIRRGADMSHVYRLDDAARPHTQGPHGRLQSEEPRVHTVVRCLPIEADGRLRYRIKSDKIERVVTEDELSYFQ